MQLILLACLFCLTLMHSIVDGSRTPKQGHIMLTGISLESNEFERQVIQVANQIEQLQIQHDTQSNPSVQRYILPVFLYVHEATRISQSPVYLALNVQASSSHEPDYRNYLQIVEIYDERYYQPILQTSPLTTFTYPNKITPFNPTNELDRHYVIAGLQDAKVKHEVIMRLSLVFVESIRFYSVRRAVQQALQMKTAVDFNVHMQVIGDWEAMTNHLVYILQTKNNFIQADQKLDPILAQKVFSVSVFHLNAAAQVNMWFLYQFIRCNNAYHQQAQDGDGSCDVDVWSETKWKVGCSNVNGKDVAVRQMNLQSCAQMCQRTASCTHFSWKDSDCYLKTGRVVATDERRNQDWHHTCGYKTPKIGFLSRNSYLGRVPTSSTPGYFGGNPIAIGQIPSNTCSNGIRRGPYNSLVLTDMRGQQHNVANRYGWSFHNKPCQGLKTGLVLYPSDTMFKNTVLLLCDNGFHYHPKAGSRHNQLMRWYYNIYGPTKQFSLVSGFYVQANGSFQFNSWQQKFPGLYTDNMNNMDACEQDTIRQVVSQQIESHTV